VPLFDYQCLDCGEKSEILIALSKDQPECKVCGSKNLKKIMSRPSSLTGSSGARFPGPSDTTCCGSNPTSAGCAGPGSCCGKA
jgi:putative FmdB family regulatory protein